MNEYILDSRDCIRLIPTRDDEPAMVELICERTMIFFELLQVSVVQYLDAVPAVPVACRALAFTCADALLGAVHQVLVPENHEDFVDFSAAFLALCPETIAPGVYHKVTCDQTGSHHHHS